MRGGWQAAGCALLVVLLAGGCRGESDFTVEAQRRPGVAQPFPGAPVQPVDSARLPAEAPLPQVQVTLSEWRVEMPESLNRGPTTFRVRNAGTRPHALEVAGGGMRERTNPIQPGGEVQVTLNLEAGEYTISCPLEDDAGSHRDRGMERRVVIR